MSLPDSSLLQLHSTFAIAVLVYYGSMQESLSNIKDVVCKMEPLLLPKHIKWCLTKFEVIAGVEVLPEISEIRFRVVGELFSIQLLAENH